MDKLGETGRVFENAYCQFAVCLPSRVSLLTGLRPDTTAVIDLKTDFRKTIPDVIAMPQWFGMEDYAVAGLGKIYHGGNPTSQDVPTSWNEGWTRHTAKKRYFEPGKSEEEDQRIAAGKPFWMHRLSMTDRGVVEDPETIDGSITQKALKQLKRLGQASRDGGKPFFLAVGYAKPHLPFNAPEKYWELYDDVDFGMAGYKGTLQHPIGAPTFAGRDRGGEPSRYEDFPKGGIKDPEMANQLVHAYYACVSFIDAQVGQLLGELKSLGLAENTIVVLWGDHGWHLGDHDGYWAKHTNYEQAVHSPLIIRYPNDPYPGKAVPQFVELVDLYPTLCDLAGIAEPKQPTGLELQGQSMVPILNNLEAQWDNVAFSQYPKKGKYMGHSIRSPRYRYTGWYERTKINDPATQAAKPEFEELYDYETDPKETHNLASDPKYATTVRQMRERLDGGKGYANSDS